MYGSLYAEGSPNHGSCPWVAYPHINNHIQIVLVIFAMRPVYMITFSYRGERVSQNTYQSAKCQSTHRTKRNLLFYSKSYIEHTSSANT
uniref:Uncharacterized protein n=1 Tax=Glossina palpalis gambiensis TaxID=67801 RepID=A0A1B0ANT8_9MUSC